MRAAPFAKLISGMRRTRYAVLLATMDSSAVSPKMQQGRTKPKLVLLASFGRVAEDAALEMSLSLLRMYRSARLLAWTQER